MTKRWRPVYGTYECPGKIVLKADELGIVIEKGRKALATTEWPGENVRLCIETEETAPLTDAIRTTILAALAELEGFSYQRAAAVEWVNKQEVEETDMAPLTEEIREAIGRMIHFYWMRYGPNESHAIVKEWLDTQ